MSWWWWGGDDHSRRGNLHVLSSPPMPLLWAPTYLPVLPVTPWQQAAPPRGRIPCGGVMSLRLDCTFLGEGQ